MKLLVTGGAGFIGSNFIRYYLSAHPDDQVVNFDKLTYAGNLENLKDIENNKSYTFIKGDICNPDQVAEALGGVNTVVHFAAESHVDRSILDPSGFIQTNVCGTQVLLDTCVKKGAVHFHHISTDEVFGSLPLDTPIKFTETTPYDPRSPYSASKAGSDHLVRSYFHTYGLPVTITNCSNNYGPYQFPEKLIPLVITNILEGKKVPVYGDGLYVRDWLYVEDHARAIDIVIQKGAIGETYCIGAGASDISNIEIIRKIIRIMGVDESVIEFVKDRPGHDRRYAIDATKIRKDLGWKPFHDLDTWLTKTVEWYSTNGDWWKRVKTGEYSSYYTLQYGEKP